MLDLYNNKYDRQTLKDNIYAVNLIDILKTQTIDHTFAVRYILNPKYHLTKDEEQISIDTILFYQKHISKEVLLQEIIYYDSDDDSVDNFETFVNRDK
jgi:hypothetical protein